MATLTRYLVRFSASVSLYNAGEEAALSADDYRCELVRKPRPLIDLLETIEDELDENGKTIQGAQKRTPAPPRPPPSDLAARDAEIADLRGKLQASQERGVLGTDPEKAKLASSVQTLAAQKTELELKLKQVVEASDLLTAKVAHLEDTLRTASAAADEGRRAIADLQAKRPPIDLLETIEDEVQTLAAQKTELSKAAKPKK